MNLNNFQIELVEGCTRRCEFCGIHKILDKCKTPNFMTLELAEKIAKEISEDFKEKIRIEFAMHGEPLLHPEVHKIIKSFRRYLPKSQLSIISNGDIILRNDENFVKKLFDAGLNFLQIDFYDEDEIRRNSLVSILKGSKIEIKEFYKDSTNIWIYRNHKIKKIILVDNFIENSGKKVTRKIHTDGGNLREELYEKYGIDKSSLPKLTRCARPFREMSINYDGNISLCCEDWCKICKIGNIKNKRLIEIWNSELINKYRYLLYHKRRDMIALCKNCNQVSFRVGLLKLDDSPYPNKKLEIAMRGGIK